nr:hypothetical protein [uncultured Prochlorococcus sp.]
MNVTNSPEIVVVVFGGVTGIGLCSLHLVFLLQVGYFIKNL